MTEDRRDRPSSGWWDEAAAPAQRSSHPQWSPSGDAPADDVMPTDVYAALSDLASRDPAHGEPVPRDFAPPQGAWPEADDVGASRVRLTRTPPADPAAVHGRPPAQYGPPRDVPPGDPHGAPAARDFRPGDAPGEYGPPGPPAGYGPPGPPAGYGPPGPPPGEVPGGPPRDSAPGGARGHYPPAALPPGKLPSRDFPPGDTQGGHGPRRLPSGEVAGPPRDFPAGDPRGGYEAAALPPTEPPGMWGAPALPAADPRDTPSRPRAAFVGDRPDGYAHPQGSDPAKMYGRPPGGDPAEMYGRGGGGDPAGTYVRRGGGDPAEMYGRPGGDDPAEMYGRGSGGDPADTYGRLAGGDPAEMYGRADGGDPAEMYGRLGGDPAETYGGAGGGDPAETYGRLAGGGFGNDSTEMFERPGEFSGGEAAGYGAAAYDDRGPGHHGAFEAVDDRSAEGMYQGPPRVEWVRADETVVAEGAVIDLSAPRAAPVTHRGRNRRRRVVVAVAALGAVLAGGVGYVALRALGADGGTTRRNAEVPFVTVAPTADPSLPDDSPSVGIPSSASASVRKTASPSASASASASATAPAATQTGTPGGTPASTGVVAAPSPSPSRTNSPHVILPAPPTSAAPVTARFSQAGNNNDGYVGTVTVTNPGTTAADWTVTITVPGAGRVTVSGGGVSVRESGDDLTFSGPSLDPGGSLTYTFTAIGPVSGPPAGCAVNGNGCS